MARRKDGRKRPFVSGIDDASSRMRLPMDCRASSEKARFALLPGNDGERGLRQ
jgi:hypothetical protein